VIQAARSNGTGAYLLPASPLEFSGVPRVPVRRAPMLGENTDEVLAEVLRMSSSEIARLHDERVLASARASER
jgi:2-methylfumaryl-CoA isomerase